ncbi:hypothetical protein BKA67DRAFT_350226 [Truncatella angustata]|uniref:Tat pathway signal sequence n=1 Tax=Truncatella angustata TaxID=152316 RepID=A0A9P8UHN3_9PEZI|nr:uncharacterized protein BKA67DRAFT_350226 [Truncatella angustata]KAH6652197.1 hypothetical protein BKA67DRAFT_350226 [Truncatella angustata]KAH8193926.1 hypothetical protein TruAng_011906 [Truncatella angustata]
MSRQQEKYDQQQPLTGPDEESIYDSESVDTLTPIDRRLRHRPTWLYVSLMVSLTAVVFIAVGGLIGRQSVNLNKTCAAYTTQYSPVLRNVDIKYEMTPFNGSFKAENIYRKVGSPEVDAAWEALGVNSRASIIDEFEGVASGLSKHHARRAEKYGGGYFVNVEGMHHLHCLNLVRKGMWYNYDYYKNLGEWSFKNEEKILQLHASHCLDVIRQVLMCNVDTGVLGQVWYDPDDGARTFPDFKTQHKCKNYDAIAQWAIDHQAPLTDSLPADYMRAPDADDVLPAIP